MQWDGDAADCVVCQPDSLLATLLCENMQMRTVLLLGLLLTSTHGLAQKTIAITLDDLPVASFSQNPGPAAIAEQKRITAEVLAVLAKHHVPATGFVNEIKVNTPGARDAYAALLQQWLDAGMELGNHGYSHLYLSDTTLENYELDFARGSVLTPLMMQQAGKREHFYRYPFNDTGDTRAKRDGFTGFLARQHYDVAPMTLENDDWMYSAVYANALARHDDATARRVRDAYLAENAQKLAFIENASQAMFQRQIPQIADLHVNELNADVLDALLGQFEQHGYTYVSLQDAVADPAYKTPDVFVGRGGVSWFWRWQRPPGATLNAKQDVDPPQWLRDAYAALSKQ